jgi:hypothetical protein
MLPDCTLVDSLSGTDTAGAYRTAGTGSVGPIDPDVVTLRPSAGEISLSRLPVASSSSSSFFFFLVLNCLSLLTPSFFAAFHQPKNWTPEVRSDIRKFSVILHYLLLGPPTFPLFLLPSITKQGRSRRLINCALTNVKVCTPTPDTAEAQRWDRRTVATIFTSCQRSGLHMSRETQYC